MARVQNTLIGRASGSVGNVVFLTWKLLNVTRSKPISVDNPNTVPQQEQRGKFAQIVGLYRALKPVLNIGLVNRNRKMTIFNWFQKLNQQTCFIDIGGGSIQFIPESLKVSYGLMTTTAITNAFASSTFDTVTIEWSSYLFSDSQSPDDLVVAVAINLDRNVVAYSLLNSTRFNGAVTFGGSGLVEPDEEFAVYLFFVNQQTKSISDTVYSNFIS